MKMRLKKTAVGLLAVVALTFGLPASPALAINQVACGNRTDFLMVHIDLNGNIGTNRCYANAGVTAVNIGGVYRVDSGNNKATVNYERDGRYHTITLEKWSGVSFGGQPRVTRSAARTPEPDRQN